jgi:L-alanine-DL-glutamate epimerase-like enolase superfamily enzyme
MRVLSRSQMYRQRRSLATSTGRSCLYTDASVTGTGEAYRGAGVSDIIHSLESVLVGENPCDIDRLHTRMLDVLSGEGSIAGAAVTAISGIEIALHDLVGRLYGVPAHQLLGGKYREEVRVYCDCHAGDHIAARRRPLTTTAVTTSTLPRHSLMRQSRRFRTVSTIHVSDSKESSLHPVARLLVQLVSHRRHVIRSDRPVESDISAVFYHRE